MDAVRIALPSALVSRFATALTAGSAQPGGRGPAVPAIAGTPSPRDLERLIAVAVARAGGTGTPRVTRSPAALYSPEYWRIELSDADRLAVGVVTLAARGVPPSA